MKKREEKEIGKRDRGYDIKEKWRGKRERKKREEKERGEGERKKREEKERKKERDIEEKT